MEISESSNKKIVLITGSTDGIGKESAIQLVKQGYHVIIHGRNNKKALGTLKQILHEVNDSELSYVVGDLGSFSEIKALVKDIYSKYSKLNMLINNAGILNNQRKLNEDGLEETIVVNYIAPFYLTNLLIGLLKEEKNSKIINIVSEVHSNHLDFENLQFEKEYTGVKAYALSKTCLIMFTYSLAEKLRAYDISVNCLHPGIINTKLLQVTSGTYGAPVSIGAESIIYAATSKELNSETGLYLKNNHREKSKEITYDKDLQGKLWAKTEEILGVKFEI